MTILNGPTRIPHYVHATVVVASLLLGVGTARAQPAASRAPTDAHTPSFTVAWTQLEHVDHAIARSELQIPRSWPPTWVTPEADQTYRRWPLRADPRRWPRLLANTTECTLSFDPVLRRHWWQ